MGLLTRRVAFWMLLRELSCTHLDPRQLTHHAANENHSSMLYPFCVARKSTPLTIDSAPDALTILEVAQILRVNRKTIYVLINEGRLRAIRVGRKFIVPKLALKRLLDLAP